MSKEDISVFDPSAGFSVVERALPHWSQAGTACFITWRLADSLPNFVLADLDREIEALMVINGLPFANWANELSGSDNNQRRQIQWKLFRIRDKFLDSGYGRCWFRQNECAKVVMSSLLYFHEERYFITDAVVMPNHVHFICSFFEEEQMLKQCEDWKRYISRAINKIVDRTGTFWQVDQFDHLVRSYEKFEQLREYIKTNPARANLNEGEYLHYSAKL